MHCHAGEPVLGCPQTATKREASVARTPEQLTIDTEGNPVAVRLRRSDRAKRLQIRIGHDGAEIVLPKRAAVHEAETFLRERSTWVLAKLSELRATRSAVHAEEQSLPDSAVLLAGEWLPLSINISQASQGQSAIRAGRRSKVSLVDDAIVLRTAGTDDTSPEDMLARWLRNRARREITQRVAIRSEEMGVQPGKLSIRDQRTRWASCSASGNLSFSWRLICAPPDVLDYIVVHELAHLAHMNHSKRFWRIVESHVGDIGRFRKWLTQRAWLIRQPIRLPAPACGEQLVLWAH